MSVSRALSVLISALAVGRGYAQTASIALQDVGPHSAQFRAGGLSVTAPDQMVLIDESFSSSPRALEGLDLSGKLLHLLTLLNDREWAQITSGGLSFNDLTGDARAAMDALLPHPFGWTESKQGTLTGAGALSDVDRQRVRIKLVRGLSFLVNLAGQPKSFTVCSTSDQAAAFGNTERRIADDGAGQQPMKSVPNEPKPSDLPYADPAYDKQVDLPATTTIAQLIDRVARATQTEIHCDFRVSGLPIVCSGKSCRAGDLLQGLALCVTGTYRKLGPAYELTSDIEGIGARKVRLAVWEDERTLQIQKMDRDWRRVIAKSGRISQIPFPKGAPFAPNDAMRAALSRSDQALTADMIPTQNMTAWVREFLQQINVNRPDSPIETARAGLQAELDCVFQLPDGRELRPENWLWSPAAYQEPVPAPAAPTAVPPFSMTSLCSDSSTRSAIVQAGDPASARWEVDLLHKFGFHDVWVEATRPSALSAAIGECSKFGMDARLLVRPWALPEDARADDEDRTILGDRGDELALRETHLDAWAAFCEEVGQPNVAPYRHISPDSDSNYSRWALIAELARTPGLAGLVLDDVQPFGYEGRRTDSWHSLAEKSMGEMSDFGYSPKQRLEFLRAHALDPIDTVGDRLNLQENLNLPFFPDDAFANAGDTPLRLLDLAWDQHRAQVYRKSLQALLGSLPKTLPLGTLISPARPTINDRAGWNVRFVSVQSSDPNYKTSPYSQVYRFHFGQKRGIMAAQLASTLSAKGPVCLDFRDVSVADLAAVLDANFMQVLAIKVVQIDRPGGN